jgi:hypothetical protein
MTQFARPTPAAADYDSTIIGALDLSEKKWVLAVQLPGVKRRGQHVVEARGNLRCERVRLHRMELGRKQCRIRTTDAEQDKCPRIAQHGRTDWSVN